MEKKRPQAEALDEVPRTRRITFPSPAVVAVILPKKGENAWVHRGRHDPLPGQNAPESLTILIPLVTESFGKRVKNVSIRRISLVLVVRVAPRRTCQGQGPHANVRGRAPMRTICRSTNHLRGIE
jgi:hypothetical protein